jgi:ectoine hydroxylase-related dioxygenase (phytanoyl-CoA dioxygenase family)
MPAGSLLMVEELNHNGFVLLPNLVSQPDLNLLLAELDRLSTNGHMKQRAGRPFGIRNLLRAVPFVNQLAETDPLRATVRAFLGEGAKLVKGLFFDKTAHANWKVSWHQDLTISVKERKDVHGFGPWTVKAGAIHVQPRTSILESMLALRIHLDDTNESNGALKVIPGSHRLGRLDSNEISRLTSATTSVSCNAARGSVLAMRPLLLHASSAGSKPDHRRVIHLEFANCDLPEGLEWNN